MNERSRLLTTNVSPAGVTSWPASPPSNFYTSQGTSSNFIRKIQVSFDDRYFRIKIFFEHPDAHKVILAIIVFTLLVTMERFTLKIAVDRLTPFSIVMIEMIMFLSMIIYFSWTTMKSLLFRLPSPSLKDFPHSKLLFIAFLDFLHFAGIIISGYKVAPSLIPVYMDGNISMNVFTSKYLFPQRIYTPNQISGATLALSSMLIALIIPFIQIYTENSCSFIIASIIFILAILAQSISSSHKEILLIAWSQPVDIHILSCWIFFYQFLLGLIFSPALFYIGGILNDFTFASPMEIFTNITDGFNCIFQGYNFDDYAEYSCYNIDCSYAVGVMLLFIVSNLLILQSIDRIVSIDTKYLGLSVIIAFVVSFLSLQLFYEDMFHSGIFIVEAISCVLLALGLDTYYIDVEPEVEVLTSYSPIMTY